MVNDINNHFSLDIDDYDTLELCSIIGVCTSSTGKFELEVEYVDKQTAFHPYSVLKTDHPKALANFILSN